MANALTPYIPNFIKPVVKPAADTLTMLGNGLLLGQGALAKGALGYAGDNTLKALGVRDGEYAPLADYIQPAAQDIANAREGSGSIGALAELGGGLASGGLALKGLMAGAKMAPAAVTRVLPKTTAVGEMGPMVPKVDIGKVIKGGLGVLGAGATYSAVSSGAPELSDFTDATTSSGTLPPKQGSAQVGAAAAEQSATPTLTKGQQMKINALAGMSFDRMNKLNAVKNAGATKAPTQKDIMLGRLDAMLQQTMNQQIEAGVDPRKAQAEYLRNASALVAPSGVPFLTSPEE
jgi:hypothetical protein